MSSPGYTSIHIMYVYIYIYICRYIYIYNSLSIYVCISIYLSIYSFIGSVVYRAWVSGVSWRLGLASHLEGQPAEGGPKATMPRP